MRILTISNNGYGAWFSTLFGGSGHSSDLYVIDSRYRDILQGIAPKKLKSFNKDILSKYDLVVFDMNMLGDAADEFKLQTNVIGDSLIADMLEDDRAFGLGVMMDCGIDVPTWEHFHSIEEAKKYILAKPKRYVLKPFESEDTASTYVSSSSEDMLAYISKLHLPKRGDFILQEVVSGVEVSTEAFFDGKEFYFINNTFEEKKFMDGNVGPNTGCAGNIVVSYGNMQTRLFRDTLWRMKTWLQENLYIGMIDINCIVDESHTWGLEFTTRFGYDATATQTIFFDDYAKFLYLIASKKASPVILRPRKGFSASVRISIPPYPFVSKKDIYKADVPVHGISEEDIEHCYLYDVKLNDSDELVSCNHEGFIAAPFYFAENFADAWDGVYRIVKDKIKIPNMQYRTDLKASTWRRYEKLRSLGWLAESSTQLD